MGTWLKANGGPLAVVVLGLGIGGFTNRSVGLALIAAGGLWFMWVHILRPYTPSVAFGPALRGPFKKLRRADPLRVTLRAIRSELGSCGQRITTAIDNKTWWSKQSELPTGKFSEHEHFLALPEMPRELDTKIELAYRECDHMNQCILDRVTKHIQSTGLSNVALSVFSFQDGDEDALRATRRLVNDANTAITARLDG